MKHLNEREPLTGQTLREDSTAINVANYTAPQPNGGGALVVPAAGAVALPAIPEGTIAAVITNPGVEIRIAFGVAASATVGTKFSADTNPMLTSAEMVAAASIYFAAACVGAYVQFYK